ncbi:MAG TPA: hypothetical protein VHX86_12025 [Tepidisphaeraceae bacterium]|jgi:hypothetical protein|nr:hypothetical protein [Tepidisphaeraceae bacterium]
MPKIIDYAIVLKRLTDEGLDCHYYNGGSFGFGAEAHVRGWIGSVDTTIKPAMLAMVRSVGEPYETNLAAMATWAWQRCLAGEVWAMPAAHWAYELSDGSREWLPGVIEGLGLDVELLRGRNNAAAIEFSTMETAKFEGFIQHLLERLGQSDFTLAFPERGTVCTVHHHKQLWWVTPHARVVEALDELMRSGS